MTLAEFETLAALEEIARARLERVCRGPHMTYPIPGADGARRGWIVAKARTIRAALALDGGELDAPE